MGQGRGLALVATPGFLQNIRWSHEESYRWSATKPRIYNSLLLTGTTTGEIIAFDLQTGVEAWQVFAEGSIRSIGVAEGFLYVGTIEGVVYKIDPK